MSKRERFYLVFNPAGARPPKFRHRSYGLAVTEARRLARENPGQEFIVLASICTALARDPVEVTDFMPEASPDEIPF